MTDPCRLNELDELNRKLAEFMGWKCPTHLDVDCARIEQKLTHEYYSRHWLNPDGKITDPSKLPDYARDIGEAMEVARKLADSEEGIAHIEVTILGPRQRTNEVAACCAIYPRIHREEPVFDNIGIETKDWSCVARAVGEYLDREKKDA